MEIPKVNAVGVLETPEGYRATPRPHGVATRGLAAIIVVAFLATMLTTGVATLARYCLTSHAGVPLPPGIFFP